MISDGSTDRTDEYVRGFESQGVQLIRIPRSGKAAALNAGMERAGGEILFFTDVRQILEKDSLRDLVSCFADPHVGVVSGELVIRSGATRGEEDVGLYWRYEKMIRKRLTRIDSIMGATGAIYAMRRQLAVPAARKTFCWMMFTCPWRPSLAVTGSFWKKTRRPMIIRLR